MDMSNRRKHPERSSNTVHAVHESLYDTWARFDENGIPAITGVGEIDPFTDAYGIDYWIWDGTALIPASPVESEQFREREAMLRLAYWRTHIDGTDLTWRWHAIMTALQAALGKVHARLSGRSV